MANMATSTPLVGSGGRPYFGSPLPVVAPNQAFSGITPALQAVIARAQQISSVPFGMYPSGGARSKDQQAALTRAGWSKTMKGAHLLGDAGDLIPIVNGQPDPNSKDGYAAIHAAMLQASKDIGVPVTWGGDYKGSFKDFPHYEVTPAAAAAFKADPNASYGAPQSLDFTSPEAYELGQAGYPGVTAPSKEALFSTLETQYGLPSGTLGGFYGIESNFGANAGTSSAGARGPFQFIPGTAKQYGLNNRDSLAASAEATAKYAADNMDGLKQALGRDPTAGELYLAHQQGLAGAISLLSNPDQPATSIVGRAAIAQNLPAGMSADGMTAGDFANFWNGQFQNKSMAFTGTPAATPAAAAAASMATSTPPVDISPPSIATQPPTVATGNAAVDRVVRSSQDSDPAAITSGWNSLIDTISSGGDIAKKSAMDAFGSVPPDVRNETAANFAFRPELWKAVPETAKVSGALGVLQSAFTTPPPLRAPLQTASEDQLTAHHAVDVMNRFGIGPSQVGETMATTPPPSAETRALAYADDTTPARTPDTAITPSSQGEVPTSVTWPSMAAATGKDPLQAFSGAQAGGSMATTPPPDTTPPDWTAGGITPPPIIGPPDTSAPPTPPVDVGVPAPAAPAPVQAAAPPAKSIAATPPSKGIGGRIYRAVAQPIAPGCSNFWSGPMVQPNFSPGSGGSTMAYQPNTGRTTTDVRGNSVNVGVYTDEHGTQHEYTWSASGAA